MANQLAQQMLKNLAEKAGQHVGQEYKTVNDESPVNVNPQEEQTLIDLIHLRNNLYPDKSLVKSKKVEHKNTPVSDSTDRMISLSELAHKAR